MPPKGFHRVRHSGLLANGNRKAMVAKARELLGMAPREAPEQTAPAAETAAPRPLPCCCPRCASRMIVTMAFEHGWAPDPRAPPHPNATMTCRRRASATKPHAANGLVSPRMPLSPANAGAAQVMGWSKWPLKTAGQGATGMGKGAMGKGAMGKGAIANTAIPESP